MHKLSTIEAGRGIAALLVVAVHARSHLLQAFGDFPLSSVFAFGHTGVDFFFVLSGFIILHVHADDVGKPSALGRYFQRRFTRIYPFYWIVFAVSALLVAVKRPLPPLTDLVSSALLLPLPTQLLVPLAWTLQHEIVFYALFAMLIVHRDLGLMLLGGWFALIVCDLLGIGGNPTEGVLTNVHTVFDFEFFLGMLAAGILRRVHVPRPRTLLLLGVAAFLGLGAAENLGLVRGVASATHLGFGFTSMLIVLGAVEAERQGLLRAPRLLVAIGGATYAIYLTHLLTIGVLWQVLLACGLADKLPAWVDLAIFIVGSIAVGCAASWVVEARVTSFTRRRLAAAGLWLRVWLRPVLDGTAGSLPSLLRVTERKVLPFVDGGAAGWPFVPRGIQVTSEEKPLMMK